MLHFSPPSCLSHLDSIFCDVGEFHCPDKDTCIPESWLCDGEPDCPDASDETDKACKSLIPSIAHNADLSPVVSAEPRA